jgi:F0F1-type ATP synthase assembly protein I
MAENKGIFDKKDAEKPSEFLKASRNYTSGWRYAEYAFQYGVSIVLCALIGYWLDAWLNTGNILLIAGVLLGSVGGFVNLLRAVNRTNPGSETNTRGKNDNGR